MANALQYLGLHRAKEGAIESTIPLAIAVAGWYVAYRFLSAPAIVRPLTALELTALFGCCAALTGWAWSRQLYLLRQRRPVVLVINAMIIAGLVLLLLPRFTRGSFSTWCAEEAGGEVVRDTPLVDDGEPARVCRVGGVPGNPYLPGTVFRPSWAGDVTPGLVLLVLAVAGISALGFRDRRLVPTGLASKLAQRLVLAPAAGIKTATGKPKAKGLDIQACANATMWGELCGQIYSKDKTFLPGESCVRCYQRFQPAQRAISFRVVTLFSGNVDELNGVERTDTVSWARGAPMPADARLSGTERWITLATVTLPDVLTVAQALALIHEMLPKWAATDDRRVKFAAKLAIQRASKVSCWIWSGRVADRMVYARPTRRAKLAIGPTRLRDLVPEVGEELTLQLDIGLLPLELRLGFRKTFLDEERGAETQNSKVDMWIPVSPPRLPKQQAGVWVPRVEGQALRVWLSTERLRADDERGTSTPLPYHVHDPRNGGPPSDGSPRPGSLDLVRMPLDRDGAEPVALGSVGASIAEWDWLEWEQIQLLRTEALVLVESAEGKRT